MPIKPENKKLYPKNWKEISKRIRFDRGNGRCEWCGVIHGRYGWRFPDGSFEEAADQSGFEEAFKATDAKDRKCPDTGSRCIKIVLTVAHLDHNPANCDDDNLVALCQRCHLDYDKDHHQENARITREKKREEKEAERGQKGIFNGTSP